MQKLIERPKIGSKQKNKLTITGQATKMEKLQKMIILFRYWMHENPNSSFILCAGGLLAAALISGTVLIHLLYLLFSSVLPGLIALIIVVIFASWVMAYKGGQDV